VEELITQFEKAMNVANPTLLAAFKRAAKGFGEAIPIHYPRLNT
jgi:hypothetical protein